MVRMAAWMVSHAQRAIHAPRAGSRLLFWNEEGGAGGRRPGDQNLYMPLRLTWLPLVVLRLVPSVVDSSRPYSHSTPSA